MEEQQAMEFGGEEGRHWTLTHQNSLMVVDGDPLFSSPPQI